MKIFQQGFLEIYDRKWRACLWSRNAFLLICFLLLVTLRAWCFFLLRDDARGDNYNLSPLVFRSFNQYNFLFISLFVTQQFISQSNLFILPFTGYELLLLLLCAPWIINSINKQKMMDSSLVCWLYIFLLINEFEFSSSLYERKCEITITVWERT